MGTHKRRLRLKPEQRFIALEIVKLRGRHRFLLGIVYRGSRWLDGLIFEPLGRKRTAGIIQIIRESPYFKELRYVLIRGPQRTDIDGMRLNEELGFPVIALGQQGGGKEKIERWGLSVEDAEALLTTFAPENSQPNALLLADLLKRELEKVA